MHPFVHLFEESQCMIQGGFGLTDKLYGNLEWWPHMIFSSKERNERFVISPEAWDIRVFYPGDLCSVYT